MKKLALALPVLVLMCSCGSSQSPSAASRITVAVGPTAPPSIDQGQSLQFTAAVSGDSTGAGVTWTATGPGCAGATCGTFSNVTSTSVTYNAPATVSTTLLVNVVAASAAAPSKKASVTLSVTPPPSIVTAAVPTASPNAIYNFTLQGSGGVPPLNWTLASGSLPTGLALNSAGLIFGTPTEGSTTTFTVKVTDSSGGMGGALSTQHSFSMSVVPILTITTTSLPNGTLGVPYSATLASSGGMPPLTWGMYTGSLPSGLMLHPQTGVISGTPNAEGTFSFEVRLVDSSSTQQSFTSPAFSITIGPSGPLTVRTTALMDAPLSVPYQAQLAASGGTAPLLWSLNSGGLPAGLALSSTGAITGTPTASPGTYSFSVTASDSSTPQQTASEPLSITVTSTPTACSSSGNNSVLTGQYAFSLRGYNGTGFLAVAGSFTADGAGNITAGEADTNGVLGAQTGSLVTSASSYSVGSDNRGCATLATPFGTFYTRFAVGAVSAGVATQGRIIEFDNPGSSAYIAAGRLFQQHPTAFLSPLTGSYSLRTGGWDPSTSGAIACVGLVTGAKYKFSSLEQDCNDNGTITNTNETFTNIGTTANTYSTADANGRGTGILLISGNFFDFTFYWISSTQLIVINSDSSPVVTEDWIQDVVPSGSSGYNQGSLNGNLVAYATSLALSGGGGDVSIATESADGSSSFTGQIYRDIAGTLQNTSLSCGYSVVAIGRVTLNGSGCGATPPIPYLNGANSAFYVGTDATVELGAIDPQATNISASLVSGTYFIGTSEIPNQAAEAEVGVVTLGADGSMTFTTDSVSTVGQSVGTAGVDTYSLNADGSFSRGSSGSSTVGIAVSGSKIVLIGNPSLTFPILLIGQR